MHLRPSKFCPEGERKWKLPAGWRQPCSSASSYSQAPPWRQALHKRRGAVAPRQAFTTGAVFSSFGKAHPSGQAPGCARRRQGWAGRGEAGPNSLAAMKPPSPSFRPHLACVLRMHPLWTARRSTAALGSASAGKAAGSPAPLTVAFPRLCFGRPTPRPRKCCGKSAFRSFPMSRPSPFCVRAETKETAFGVPRLLPSQDRGRGEAARDSLRSQGHGGGRTR